VRFQVLVECSKGDGRDGDEEVANDGKAGYPRAVNQKMIFSESVINKE
jgi:hypothetical protein